MTLAQRQPENVNPSPSKRGGVTRSVVLVLLAAAVLLAGGVVTELKTSRQAAIDAARSAAVLMSERLAEEPSLQLAPGDTSTVRVADVLDQFTPENGASFLITIQNGQAVVARQSGSLRYDPIWLGGAPAPGYRLAIRRLSDSATIIVAAPAAPPVGVLLPYVATAVLLILGAALIIKRLERFADEAEILRRDRDRILHQYLALENGGVGIWRVSDAFLTLPPNLRALLGCAEKPATIPLDEAGTIFDPRDVGRALSFFRGTTERADVRLLMMDAAGKPRSIFFHAFPTDSGRQGLALAISDQALNDGQSRQLIRRLHETLEAIPQAFLHWDNDHRLVTWNDRFCEIFGVGSGHLRPGLAVDDVAALISIDPHYLRNYFAPPTAFQPEKEVHFPEERCLRIIRKQTSGGGWMCIGHDITDTKVEGEARARKEQELQKTVQILEQSRQELSELNERYAIERQRAEDANRAKTEFLANVSHELRTPLNAINGFSAVMQSELYGPLGSEKYSEYVSDINDSGRHLLELIDEILDLSKVEAGKMELRLNTVDLEKIMAESIRVIEPQTRAHDINLHATYDHLPTVFADARAVKQVILNLLTNAAKFTEAGGRITVTTLSDLESVTIIVADTGDGIDGENIKRLGTPFVNFESAQKRDKRGTGLGLALSKSLLEAMDGILCIASERGRGTVAALTLPRRPGSAAVLPDILAGKVHVLTKLNAPHAPSDIDRLAAG